MIKNKVIDVFIEGDGDDEFTKGYNFAVKKYKKKIKAIPDIQIVKHSKWEINSDGYYPFCLSCGSTTDKLTKYCPNCGAKMDGDNND